MGRQNTVKQKKQTINCRGKLLSLDIPKVMGILNVTPDSFYDGGMHSGNELVLKQAERMLDEGADMLDIGGMSSRPGAKDISEKEELNRVVPAIKMLRNAFPNSILSVDTFRSRVAQESLDAGADMVNDISGGELDEKMLKVIAREQVPYVMMHMQGTPQTMQTDPKYNDVTQDVLRFFIQKLKAIKALYIHDIIIDPGFGFGKTLEHNFHLLNHLNQLDILGHPLLVGISRKGMVSKPLGIGAKEALNGTTALHMIALERGANLLRVHDVKEAKECIRLHQNLKNQA